jgi:hypothetical protein
VSEFERYGVPRCRVIITVLPHPDHPDWFDLSFIYWGFITHEAVESAALRVLTDFCDHNPTVVALSPFGLFPAVSRVHLTVGNRSGYRGNRSYRSGSVRKKLGNRSLTEPSKPLFSVYRSVLPVYRTGFGGLENRSSSGF